VFANTGRLQHSARAFVMNPSLPCGCRCPVTPVGHNAVVTLFDWPTAGEPDPGERGRQQPTAEPDELIAPSDPVPRVEPVPVAVPARPGWPEVEIRTSTRRRKTSEARWVGGRIVVSLPAHLKGKEREKTIAWLVDRLVAKHPLRTAVGDDELMIRARALCDRYSLEVRPTSVRWVTNQSARWGSCSYHSREIRLSHRLRAVPEWVLDAVLVHELAHLVHPNHSAAFHATANRFPRHHEAGVFLAGYGLGLSGPDA
jgi:hypothetical protein